MLDLKIISRETSSILPGNLSEFTEQINSGGGVAPYIEALGLRITDIFDRNNVDIGSDDNDVIEFRHFMKQLACRVAKSVDNPEESYFWIDTFRKNINDFFITGNVTLK